MQLLFEGTLTTRDSKRHIPHSFDLPAGCEQLEIRFHFTPHRVHDTTNLLTLTLFDPDGFRGAGHRGGNSHEVRITPARATPGYLPGPLPAGVWTVQIDTHMTMPGDAIHYHVDITANADLMDAQESRPALSASSSSQPKRGAGWYRGDLHSHTHHSDAGERSAADLVQMAREHSLDFIFLTDHNTTSGLAEVEALGGEDILTAGGIELTTFWGHALCLGTRRWIDWRIRPGTGAINTIAANTYTEDQLFIIAHPNSVGDPYCTGCAWRYGEMMPGNAELVEIWNGPWAGDSNNEATLSLWYDWLNQGRRIVATAGTDTHGNQDYATGPGFSVVYAEELSEAAILASIRAGHLYLSSGPQLEFDAHVGDGRRLTMGVTVSQAATLEATWSNCPADARLRLLFNGKLLEECKTGAEGSREWHTEPDQVDWAVVEVRDHSGELLAITNPIYFAAQSKIGG